MELIEQIARIASESKTGRVTGVDFSKDLALKFRCQRCAVFCCKLGGPKLSSRDIESLKQIGQSADAVVDYGQMTIKSKRDGSCLFLDIDSGNGSYRCSIYEDRPDSCRLYPFEITKLNPNSYALKLIPCCNGLNVHDGEVVDRKFLVDYLGRILANLSDPNTST